VSNFMCEMGQAGSGWGNILEIKVKEGGTYKCTSQDRNYPDKCSWDNHGVYRENTNNYEHGRWKVLGRADGCCDNYGLNWLGIPWTIASVACECMMGPVAGVSYHAASNQVWSTNLQALYKIDRSSGEGHGPIQATSWYGDFQSEYRSDGYTYGAVDNTKWLADGDTLIAGIYEAFYYHWNAGVPSSAVQAPGAAASLDEQYGGIRSTSSSRKWRTRFHHVIASAFCPTSYSTSMSNEQVTAITRIFSYNPSADDRIDMDANNQQACQRYDPDELPDTSLNTLDAPCFSGRVTHIEPVFSHDSFVAVNYQSKAVLVLQNAVLSRLECRGWVR
jgi:hypothetical protein